MVGPFRCDPGYRLSASHPVLSGLPMNDAFASFLHALPFILGFGILIGCLYGFWRGLTLRARDADERSPDPVSPSQALSDRFAAPPVWPGWIRRVFNRR
jgi:hypothetical protein